MRALLSIKPHFAERILAGEKRFEFRRTTFRTREVKTVLIYATLPVGRIVGQFRVDEILVGTPSSIWRQTRASAGIVKAEYDNYFADRSLGYAIRIGEPLKYKRPKELADVLASGRAPQSFCYLD